MKGGVQMGFRFLPYKKAKKGIQIAGVDYDDSGGSYTLPTASSEVLGGVKVGSGLSIIDGVLSTTGSGGGGSDESISYDEVEVGTAPDGKKLYKKTVKISKMLSTNELHEQYHGIENISKIWRFYGFYYFNGTIQMMGYHGTNYAIIVKVTNTSIMYYNNYYDVPADITIYYTKTTD